MHTIEQNSFINQSYYLPGNNEIILWRIIGKIVIIFNMKIELLYFCNFSRRCLLECRSNGESRKNKWLSGTLCCVVSFKV